MALNRIGQAFIDISVKGQDKVRQAFSNVKRTAQTSTTEANKATGNFARRTERSFREVSERVDDSVQGFDDLLGSFNRIAGLGGAVAGVFGAIGFGISKLAEKFESGTSKAEKFADSLILEDPQTQAQKLRDRIAEVNATLGSAARSGNILTRNFQALAGQGELFGNLEEQAKALADELEDVNGLLRAQKRQREQLRDAARTEFETQLDAINAQRERIRLEERLAAASNTDERVQAQIDLARFEQRNQRQALRREEEIARTRFRANEINRQELEEQLRLIEARAQLIDETTRQQIRAAGREADSKRDAAEQAERKLRAERESLSVLQQTAQQIGEINRIQQRTADILEDIRNTRTDDSQVQTLRTIQQELGRIRSDVANGRP